jgi:hypothetical protein
VGRAIISVVIPADAAVIRTPDVPRNDYNGATLNPSPGEHDLATLGNIDERQQPVRAFGTELRRNGHDHDTEATP